MKKLYFLVITFLCIISLFVVLPYTEARAKRNTDNHSQEKYALIYNGPVSADDCPEAAAAIAESVGLKVKFISDIRKLPPLLENAAVFIIGGTGDDLEPLMKEFTPQVTKALKNYLQNGGRYLGICGGGFVASTGWNENGYQIKGVGIVPAASDCFLPDSVPRILPIRWLGKIRLMYFKAGPFFKLNKTKESVEIVAAYSNGSIAAFRSSYGKGKVAVCGPHPEARESWRGEAVDGGKWASSAALASALLRDLLSDRQIGNSSGHAE